MLAVRMDIARAHRRDKSFRAPSLRCQIHRYGRQHDAAIHADARGELMPFAMIDTHFRILLRGFRGDARITARIAARLFYRHNTPKRIASPVSAILS